MVFGYARVSTNEQVLEKDGACYLAANQDYFDVSKTATLSTDLEVVEMSFSDKNFP